VHAKLLSCVLINTHFRLNVFFVPSDFFLNFIRSFTDGYKFADAQTLTVKEQVNGNRVHIIRCFSYLFSWLSLEILFVL